MLSKVEIDRYIGLANILGQYLGFTDIPVLAAVDVDKGLLYYSSRIQTTCGRKHNKPS